MSSPCSAIRAAASSSSAARRAGALSFRGRVPRNTRKGKQVLNVKPPDEARAIAPVDGDFVAAIGENRKLVIFPLDQTPEMTRGRGVRLQRHKDGGLSDLKTFKGADGLGWTDAPPRLQSDAQGDCRLARQSRRRRTARAEGIRKPTNSKIRRARRQTAARRAYKLRIQQSNIC